MKTEPLPKLNPRHQTFVDLYLANGLNSSKAATDAGYSRGKKQGYELLQRPDVRAHVDARMEALHQQGLLDERKIIKQLSDMAQVDMAELYNENGSLKNIHDMPKHVRLCISEVTPTPSGYKVKLEGRQKALELVGKYLKLWVERSEVDHTTRGESLNQASEEQIAKAKAEILANLSE